MSIRQVRYEQRTFWRNPEAAAFAFALPLVFMFIFALFFSGETVKQRGNLDYMQFMLPGVIAFGVISTTYTYLSVGTAQLRDWGVLKRVRGTPLPGSAYLIGRSLSSAISALLFTAVAIPIGMLAYDVHFYGGTALALVATLVLGILCFALLGLAITGIIPNAEAAPPIAIGLMLPLVLLSGIFIPNERMPGWLVRVTDLLPMSHFAHALQYAFDPRTSGMGFRGVDLLIVGAWTVAAFVLATIGFKWENAR
jgi:ABC-2 type transport system permease protein